MTISEGDRLPDVTFRTMTAEGPQKLSTAEVFDGRKVVLFAVPGAFTPGCHVKHLPGFIEHAEAIKTKGVDRVACVAVNDVHVLNAWAKQTGADASIMFLADGDGEFTRAVGMDEDRSDIGMGLRSKRYAMIVDDGRVAALFVEPKRGVVEASSAEHVLSVL